MKRFNLPAAIALVFYGGLMVAFAESRGEPFWARFAIAATAGACFLVVARGLIRRSGPAEPRS